MFRLEISQILTKFTKYWGLINFSWIWLNDVEGMITSYTTSNFWGMESECMNPNNWVVYNLSFCAPEKI